MAISCVNPNTIGTEAEELFSYIVSSNGGKGLLDKFEESINSFKSHWIGSDAKRNITKLITVHSGINELLSNIENYIVSVNNNQILELQREIVASGGTCTQGNELAFISVGAALTPPEDTLEHRVDDAMLTDAANFQDIPTKFETFVTEINSLKDALLRNWTDGANREKVVESFKEFNDDVEFFKTTLTEVKNEIDIVASNKKPLM